MSHTEGQIVPNLTYWQTMSWVYIECDQCVDRIKLSLSVGTIYTAAVNVKVCYCSLCNLTKQRDITVCQMLFISIIARYSTYI